MMFKITLLSLLGLGAATILADMEQGAKFDQCIAIADWEGKTLADDITLQVRDANGCCPEGTVPGVKHYNKYVGAQVVCGFKPDGTIDSSSSTSNDVKTCTYNQCYVWKQNLECSSGRQRLNGCCADKADCSGGNCGFKDGCENYVYANPGNSDTKYCLTYNTNYEMKYTSAKDDDQADNKLQIDKVYQYTKCSSGESGGAGSSLQWLGANPSNLAVCQGDCDTDGDCPGASQCIQRTGGTPAVDGCATGDSGESARADTDYCNNPSASATPAPAPAATAAPDTESSGAQWMPLGLAGLFLASLVAIENA